MIREEDVYILGQITKTHGIHGELVLNFTDDSFDQEETGYVILRMDGILVPFFISSLRFRSDSSALLMLDGIDTEEKARNLTGKDVYFPLAHRIIPEEEDLEEADFLEGFTAVDKRTGLLGTITYVDESTMNTLLVIERMGKELLVPLHEELVLSIDQEKRQILMDLPSGLLDLDHAQADTDE